VGAVQKAIAILVIFVGLSVWAGAEALDQAVEPIAAGAPAPLALDPHDLQGILVKAMGTDPTHWPSPLSSP
jgi:hypothetical protein